MKTIHNYFKIFVITAVLITGNACETEEVVDPNNPSLGGVLNNASKAELQTLVTGLEARHRNYFENATEMFGSFAREVWPFFASDPRFFGDWLGDATYPDFFGAGGTYLTPYLAVKQANVLIESVANTNSVTTAEAAGYTGFAKTIKGFQLLWPLMQQYQNGIRVDVSDPLNPGPVLGYDEALTQIRALLDAGRNDLLAAGSEFDFNLTMGFASPAEMLQVNRAIAARVALYDGDWQGALDALDESFMDLTADEASEMNVGPVLAYGNDPDIPNPLFYPLDASTSTILIAHPAMVEDLLPGDTRASKFYERNEPVIASGFPFTGDYQDARWGSNTESIAFIRNEELILIYAEANANLGNTTNAVDAINTIRNTWGVADYAGATTLDALVEEILFQRRYSLWAEGGHRWIDLRRTGKLDAAHVDLRDREGGSTTLIQQIDRPTSETNWDENN